MASVVRCLQAVGLPYTRGARPGIIGPPNNFGSAESAAQHRPVFGKPKSTREFSTSLSAFALEFRFEV